MEQLRTINLISTKTELPETLVALTKHLHKVGLVSVLISLGLGLFFGVGITIVQLRVTALAQEKNTLIARITSAAKKEGMYAVLLKQSGVAQKVLAAVKPWDAVIDEVNTIAPEQTLLSASVNEKQDLSLTAQIPSVEEAALMVGRISNLATQKKIHNAVLESLEVGNDGKVKLVITFTPTL